MNDVMISAKIYDLSSRNNNGFNVPIGSWVRVASQSADQPLSSSWTLGYSTADTQGKTQTHTFSQELSYTMEASCKFFGTGGKETLSASALKSIANTMSSAVTTQRSESRTCAGVCQANTCPPGEVFLYNFQVSFDRKQGSFPGGQSTRAVACDYICRCSNTPPKCPVGFCADSRCNTCKPYQKAATIVSVVNGTSSLFV